MANKKISELDPAASLTGTELVEIVQSGGNVRTTTQDIANLAPGGSSASQWKAPVKAATTTNGTLASAYENGDTIDGITLSTGDRILLKNQTTQTENGIYTVNASGAPTRATDADTAAELEGATVVVQRGTANADTVWLQTTDGITLGSSNIVWSRMSFIDAVETLTNKRITPRVQSVTSSATVTPNADNDDAVKVTAQAAGLTLANPSGTPTAMQAMIVRIKDNGTARSLTYGSQYRAIGVSLPTTTVISKTLYLGLVWNSDDTKWDVVGLSQES